MDNIEKIIMALYEEIEHGDEEHQEWLYNKMREFLEHEIGKQFKLDMPQSESMPQQTTPPQLVADRELTFGEKAAGVTFNPSNNQDVDSIKRAFASIIDQLDSMRTKAIGGDIKRYYSKAISYAEDAQMNAVKAITWRY